jgi:hypothetical protein
MINCSYSLSVPRNFRRLALFLALAFCSAIPAQHTLAAPASTLPASSIQEVDAKVLAARRAIRSAKFDVSRRLWTRRHQQHPDDRIVSWMDLTDGRIREDAFRNGGRLVRSYSHRCFTVLDEKHGEFQLADRRKWPTISMVPVGDVDRPGEPRTIHNPYTLMLSPGHYESNHLYHAEAYVNGTGRDNLRIREQRRSERKVFTVSFSRSDGDNRVDYEYDVAAESGYSVTRMWSKLFTVDPKRAQVEQIVESEPMEVAPQIWFPRSVRARQFVGGQLYVDELLTIKVSQINEYLPESHFEPPGLDIPVGTLVFRGTGSKQEALKWDGHQLLPMTQRDWAERAIVRPTQVESSRRRALLWASLACAAAALSGWLISSLRSRVQRTVPTS